MSIELLTDDHREKILEAFQTATEKIAIITPFLSLKTAEFLTSLVQKSNTLSCEFVTRFDHSDFLQKASTTKGLKKLLNVGVTVLAAKKLHTKLYLLDKDTAILGSANFTVSGLQSNCELSLLIKNEPELLAELWDYFDELAQVCKKQGKYISEKEIDDEDKRLHNEAKPVTPTKYTYSFGAEISFKKENSPDFDIVQRMVNPAPEIDCHCWIKFEATSRIRKDGSIPYDFHFENGTYKTCFSEWRKPKKVHEGDWIYIATHSWDKEGNPAPMIVGRAKCHAFKEENRQSEDSQWPIYLELYEPERLAGKIEDGISLYTLVEQCKKCTYIHTKNNITVEEDRVKYSHRQQAYLGLAQEAVQYLESVFEERGIPYQLPSSN